MNLAQLFESVKADRGRTPKPMKDWKKKILDPSTTPDDWDFNGISDNTIVRRAQFESQWEEVQLAYVIQPVHCSCGWQHDEHWGVFLHEQHRQQPTTIRFTRLVRNLSQYRDLPRSVITHDPIKSPVCDRCFGEVGPEQYQLPINDLQANDITGIVRGVEAVVDAATTDMAKKDKLAKEYGDNLGPAINTIDDDESNLVEAAKSHKFERTKAVDELDW